MMNSITSGTFLLFVLCDAVSGLGSVVRKEYFHITHHYTWSAAQHYCRSHYNSDLAIIYTQSDADNLNLNQYKAWIGLHRPPDDDEFTWTHGDTSYRNWALDEPSSSDSCVNVHYPDYRFYGSGCDARCFIVCCYCHGNFQYYFIPQSKTWTEALDFCKNGYHDMATFYNMDDIKSAVQPQNFPVWTGLHRHEGTWKWIKGLSEYRNWTEGQPQDNNDCVSISSLSKEMSTQSCSSHFPFLCFRDNLVLVKENKTWEEALEHCRALSSYHTLLSVQPGSDQDYIVKRVMEADTEKVWTGLRFLAGQWLWVNMADMLYSDLPVCPLEWQHCGALSKNASETIHIRECSERRNFLCYRV